MQPVVYKEWMQRNLNTIIPIAGLIVLILSLRTANPYFLASWDSVITLVYGMSFFLVAACGLTLVILMGSFDFSIPSVLKLSAMIFAVLYPSLGFYSLPVTLAVALAFGFVNGLLLARFNIPSFMATLATSMVAEGLAQVISGGYTRIITDPAFRAISTTMIFGLPSIFYWAIAVWVVTVFITLATPFGRAVYAIGGNLVGARLAGINILRVRILVFMIGALFAAVSGILYASQIQGAHMQVGVLDTIPLFASVVVGGTALTGGVGGVHRTLLGVLIIRWLDSGLSMLAIDLNIRMIIFGAIAIIMAILTIDRKRIKIMK
ncbi:MAG: ABC transporter permease [Candidatus Caldarchaeum sp.]|nr:ABC transporter permease [Candidatus Caldarchaeum sp.]MCS7134194.1 ABC transporter permease [Candidatus Caldarchaeum sp.]MCX8200857.1 ABC transporter permease [Candidatus Caldarchaeum sp.]MDW8063320.1 ABC transporter permease [Candidatus Caldarchaeum sp.]MDW8434820.1 ABC transporter permease [Candidatus Caldarchaeum sp.]